MTPELSTSMELVDGQRVSVELLTARPITLNDVVIRVSDQFSNRLHIDFDEANAALVSGFTMGRIITE